MQNRPVESPIRETYEKWPLAANHSLRWGRDAEGEMWVAVEDKEGVCEAVLPYQAYLDMEKGRIPFTF